MKKNVAHGAKSVTHATKPGTWRLCAKASQSHPGKWLTWRNLKKETEMWRHLPSATWRQRPQSHQLEGSGSSGDPQQDIKAVTAPATDTLLCLSKPPHCL